MSVTQIHNTATIAPDKPTLGVEVERAPARLVGSRAAALTATPGYAGRVIAVCSQTVYLRGFDDEILWLAPLDSAKHRRCILAEFDPGSLTVGMRFDAFGQCLRFEHALTIDLSRARCWRPRRCTPQGRGSLTATNLSRLEALEAVGSLPNPTGLGRIVNELTAPLALSKALGRDPLIDRAWPAVRAMSQACRRGDIPRMLAAGRELIGLGPGLTPSGDDFVGGALFSARHLAAAYPEEFGMAPTSVQGFVEGVRPLTNRISFAILSDLAHGHGPEPLHDFVTSQLRGETGHRALEAAQRTTEIGHSSGYDLLAGAVTGMMFTEAIVGYKQARGVGTTGGVPTEPLCDSHIRRRQQ